METRLFVALSLYCLCIANCYLNDISISGSTMQTSINGRYVYHSWNTNFSGPIYCKSAGTFYLYPYISSSGAKFYIIDENMHTTTGNAHCKIPSTSNPMSPHDCYNDYGHQLLAGYSGSWVDDTTTVLINCNTTDNMNFQTAPTTTFTSWTEMYGKQHNDDVHTHADQGRITGIASWGLFSETGHDFTNALGNFTWTSDDISTVSVMGGGPTFDNNICDPFNLSEDRHINGYRIIYGEYVWGLIFYSFINGTYESFECFAYGGILSEYLDSGVIYYPNHYLSGFIFHDGWVIDGIQFQFSSILESDAICIYNSTYDTSVNGRYEYYSWHTTANGPIYRHTVNMMYLYPLIYSSGNKYYGINYDIGDSNTIQNCRIPTISNPMLPYHCYNDDGGQFLSGTTSDPNTVLMDCPPTPSPTASPVDISHCMSLYSSMLL